MNRLPRSAVLIWGASGHAKVVREALGDRARDVCAVLDNAEVPAPFEDVPLYCGPEALAAWLADVKAPGEIEFVVAIGGARGEDRISLHDRLVASGLHPMSLVHRTAFVATGARCQPGSQVLALAAVCEGTVVGRESIVNTGATIDHESVIGDGVHIAPGANLAGLVQVDDLAFIGTGATVLPRVHIGRGAVVGAGAVVLEDVLPGTTVVGNPARALGRQT